MSYSAQFNERHPTWKEQEILFKWIFGLVSMWITVRTERKIIKIFKYSCLLQYIMKTMSKERPTVYFAFQTFPDTYQEIHLTKRNKISVSFFVFSNGSEVIRLVEFGFLQWQLSRQPALESTSLQLVQLPHNRATKVTAFHIIPFQVEKGKTNIETVCPLWYL